MSAEQAYQFSNDGVLRLPPFQLGPRLTQQVGPKAGGSNRVAAKDVKVLTIYGRVYCAHTDYKQRRLSLYRFFK